MTETKINKGDIFVCRWGRIDKIVDFYKVIKKTKCTVVIKTLKNKVVEESHRDGPAGSDMVVPSGKFDESQGNSEMKKRIQSDGSLKITSYSWAVKWDGKPVEKIFGYY